MYRHPHRYLNNSVNHHTGQSSFYHDQGHQADFKQATTILGERFEQHTVTTTRYTTVTAMATSTSASVISPTPSSVQEVYQCPSQNGMTVVEDGTTYSVQCGADYPGNDITSAPATSLAQCEQMCSAHNDAQDMETRCEAVVFRTDQQRCYLKPYPLKASKPNPYANAALGSAMVVSSTASSSTASS